MLMPNSQRKAPFHCDGDGERTKAGQPTEDPSRAKVGFTLIEALLVIGILGIIMVFSVSRFRQSQVRSDLDQAKENVVQGFARAKMLSQTAQGDSEWGFYVPAGVLYKGSSYTARDPVNDEVYPMPSSVVVNGVLLEVSFTKLEGRPSASGTIVLQGLDEQQRTVSITLYMGGEERIASSSSLGASVNICHKPGMHNESQMTVPSAAWLAHQAHGDILGMCPGDEGSVACTEISIQDSGNILTADGVDMTVTVLAKNLKYGEGAAVPDIPVTLKYTDDGGIQWKKLFNDNPITSIPPDNVDTKGNIQENSQVALQMYGHYEEDGWTVYDSTAETNDADSGHALILRDGDAIPTYFDNTELVGVLQNNPTGENFAPDGEHIELADPCSVVVITELSDVLVPPPVSEDYTDAVFLLQFTED
ncbi:MAG: type II secretion system protein [Patescibacteria group bacterium]